MKPHEIISKMLIDLAKIPKPGVKTEAIAEAAWQMIKFYKVESCNLNYKPLWAKMPFPACCCVNVNFVIAHGIPTNYIIKEGDLINIDLGIKKGNKCADAALTVGVGQLAAKDEHLLKYAKRVLYAAIKEVKAGVNTRVITETIERTAARHGYKVNRRMAGHTIGREMHMKPNIFNTVEPDHEGKFADLKAGQVICIEPQVTYSRDNLGVMATNSWECFTADAKNSAYFEHMVKVTDTGYEILTNHIQEE